MMLTSKDILVVLKLACNGDDQWTQVRLATDLGLSPSQVSYSLARLEAARLYSKVIRRVSRAALEEFLIHGVKYAFPAQRGSITRGLPTAYAAPPLSNQIRQSDEPPPVWPVAHGTIRGYAFEPIDEHAPDAALRDKQLYELLALVDALRDGRARESALAATELKARLGISYCPQ
jgi:hypothetical protein